jgi:alpha-L-fucosidase
MTEACNSLGRQSWGYRENEDFYSYRHLVSSIDRIMAMGGSYLLNVGPNGLGEITEEYAVRLRRIGDWYKRTEGCLESAEGDSFDYSVRHDPCIVNRKNGKIYFHLYNSASSSAVDIKFFPHKPTRVRLLNTGEELAFSFERLPEFFNGKTGRAEQEYLHITGIPIDELSDEAIVLEISIE